jgi:hypothetical protein
MLGDDSETKMPFVSWGAGIEAKEYGLLGIF